MAAVGLILSLLFVPDIEKMNGDTISSEKKTNKTNKTLALSIQELLSALNPIRVFVFLLYPNVLLAVRTFCLLATSCLRELTTFGLVPHLRAPRLLPILSSHICSRNLRLAVPSDHRSCQRAVLSRAWLRLLGREHCGRPTLRQDSQEIRSEA